MPQILFDEEAWMSVSELSIHLTYHYEGKVVDASWHIDGVNASYGQKGFKSAPFIILPLSLKSLSTNWLIDWIT